MQHMMLSPWRMAAKNAQVMYDHPFNPFYYSPWNRTASAGIEVFERITRKYEKPLFGLMHTYVNGKEVLIEEDNELPPTK